MARQVLPWVGAIIGGVVSMGNPMAIQAGFAIGSLVGNVIDPVILKAPSIGDGQTQTSQEGVPYNRVYGTACCSGNVLARGELKKYIKKTQQGKGGPVQEEERFSLTFAIGITCHEIEAITRIWEDEKLVYDVRAKGSQVAPEENIKFAQRFRFFNGSNTQEPSADLEVVFGAGNTPSYRGRSYIVFPNADVTDRRGSIPTYRFEVVQSGVIPVPTLFTDHVMVTGTPDNYQFVDGNPGTTDFQPKWKNVEESAFYVSADGRFVINCETDTTVPSGGVSTMGSNVWRRVGDSADFELVKNLPSLRFSCNLNRCLSKDGTYLIIPNDRTDVIGGTAEQQSAYAGTIALEFWALDEEEGIADEPFYTWYFPKVITTYSYDAGTNTYTPNYRNISLCNAGSGLRSGYATDGDNLYFMVSTRRVDDRLLEVDPVVLQVVLDNDGQEVAESFVYQDDDGSSGAAGYSIYRINDGFGSPTQILYSNQGFLIISGSGAGSDSIAKIKTIVPSVFTSTIGQASAPQLEPGRPFIGPNGQGEHMIVYERNVDGMLSVILATAQSGPDVMMGIGCSFPRFLISGGGVPSYADNDALDPYGDSSTGVMGGGNSLGVAQLFGGSYVATMGRGSVGGSLTDVNAVKMRIYSKDPASFDDFNLVKEYTYGDFIANKPALDNLPLNFIYPQLRFPGNPNFIATTGKFPLDAIIRDLADLCEPGLDDKMDTSDLEGDTVEGFVIANQYGAKQIIGSLQQCHFFDPSEYDEQVHFISRGKPVQFTLTEEDLLDGDPWSQLRRSSIEYPKTLNLTYQNATSGYDLAKATTIRSSPSHTVSGERSIAVAEVLGTDRAAQVSDIQMKIAWAEAAGKFEFSMPATWHDKWVPSDVVALYLGETPYRLRVEKMERADGVLKIEALVDRQSAYTSNVTGIPARIPTPPPPTIQGVMKLMYLNIPALVDSNDVLGYYMGTSGTRDAYSGGVVERKHDGVAEDYSSILTVSSGRTLARLLEPLPAASQHYVDTTNAVHLKVWGTDFEAFQSIANDTFLRKNNGIAILNDAGQAELLQYRDAEYLGDGEYRLTHLLRGELNTTPLTFAEGSMLAVLDDVSLVVVDGTEIGSIFDHRGTAYGESPQDSAVQVNSFAQPLMQTEFPVDLLDVSLAGSTATTTWSPRERFGSDVNPIRSVNWASYRITYTDGTTTETFDTLLPTHTHDVSSYSGTLTVSVAQVNRLTGPGPATIFTLAL